MKNMILVFSVLWDIFMGGNNVEKKEIRFGFGFGALKAIFTKE